MKRTVNSSSSLSSKRPLLHVPMLQRRGLSEAHHDEESDDNAEEVWYDGQ